MRSGAGAARESAVVVFGSAGVERMVTRSTDVEFVPNDWSRDGSALLGACRFGQAERFGVCLMPLSSARKVGGPTIRVIASRSLIVSVASGFSRRPHFR
jgi:hypothetical protein